MKKNLLNISATIISAIVFFFSCTKAKDVFAPTLYPLSSYNMSANSSGQFLTFNATASYGSYDTIITISAGWNNADGQGSTYHMNFNALAVSKGYIGTYPVSAVFSGINTSSIGSLFTYTSSLNSSISITAYDSINKTITGTFSFAATGGASSSNNQYYPASINVTNGVFTKVPL